MLSSLPRPQLPIARYRFEFGVATPRQAPRFAGSAWRGALGHELRRIACLTGAPECHDCPLLHQCAYSYLFATPVPPDASKLTRYPEAPNPYVLLEEQLTSSRIRLHLTLIGKANHHLPLMYQALLRGAGSARGVAGRRLEISALHQWMESDQDWVQVPIQHGLPQAYPSFDPATPPLPVGIIRIDFITPLRIRRNGQHVTPQQFCFADLFSHLLRRISLLSSFHTDTPLDTDFRGLTQHARGIQPLNMELRWMDLMRHSQRQQADMAFGGLVGYVHLDASRLEPFWPYLWLGQYTHVGRATTMGLGAYRIRTESFPPSPPGT